MCSENDSVIVTVPSRKIEIITMFFFVQYFAYKKDIELVCSDARDLNIAIVLTRGWSD